MVMVHGLTGSNHCIARKKAQAQAAALRREEQRAARKSGAGGTSHSASAHEAETNNDDDGIMSSTSSLTDLDDHSDQEMNGDVKDSPKQERRTTLPRAKRENVKKIPPQPANMQSTRQNRRSSALLPVEPKNIEIPAGFKLQIGPGTKPRPRDEISPTKAKRDTVMGEPPAINEKGHMESGTYGMCL